jgi:lipopolysaccharide transport system ATP-binding protein
MSDTVISVENLGKRYIIGHESRHDNLRDTLHHHARKLWRRFRWGTGFTTEEFWALRDVSFTVNQGEVVGIIGRNGAGKSTLLKILSRITEPTQGRVTVRGRVASLLEVGTGFHPELTGRENIFLNGAILGMSRAEITRKFDEIVAFAEVERFLDTPVKHYSSGMYVRLAFAVAAHLEPEILIVDEVLSVGDAAFQKKCLGKMQSVSRQEGRTVLFVSHDVAAVSGLTMRCILLDRGRTVQFGSTIEVVNTYLARLRQTGVYKAPAGRPSPRVEQVEVNNSHDAGVQGFGEPMGVSIMIDHRVPICNACVSFQVVNQFNQPVIHQWIFANEVNFGSASGHTTLICKMPRIRLNVGTYAIRVYLSEPPGGKIFEVVDGVCSFDVVRLEKPPMWGWRPESCAYHEESTWSLAPSARP